MKKTLIYTLIITTMLTLSCSMLQSSTPAPRSFSLHPWPDESQKSLTELTITVPPSWEMKQVDKNSVSFKPPEMHKAEVYAFLTINLVSCLEKAPRACLEYLIKRQFDGYDPSQVTRVNLSPHQVWVESEDLSKGLIKTGRFFVVDEKTGRLASANLTLRDDTLKYFEAYKKASQTLTFD